MTGGLGTTPVRRTCRPTGRLSHPEGRKRQDSSPRAFWRLRTQIKPRRRYRAFLPISPGQERSFLPAPVIGAPRMQRSTAQVLWVGRSSVIHHAGEDDLQFEQIQEPALLLEALLQVKPAKR